MTKDHEKNEKINLIISLFSNGQEKKALGLIDKLAQDFPNEPVLANIKGACYQNLGDYDRAIKYFNIAIDLNNDYVKAHFNLGGALYELGYNDASIKSFQKAIEIEPKNVQALNNLGNVYKSIGQLKDSIFCYKNAVSLEPDYFEANYNLGLIYEELGDLDNAIKFFKKALAINPKFAELHNNLGVLLMSISDIDSAIEHFNNALVFNPNFAEAYNNLGNAFIETNKIKDAIRQYEHAVLINPDFSEAYFNLYTSSIYTPRDKDISKMNSLLNEARLNNSDRIYLNFALAKVNEDLGNYGEFFKFLNKGNDLQKQELNYSFKIDQEIVSKIKCIFDEILFSNKVMSYKPASVRPIFIVGMPRSGTSLVEQIISSHSEVYGAGELTFLPDIIEPIIKDCCHSGKFNPNIDIFLKIREKYLNMLLSIVNNGGPITDKLPLNFQYIGFILSAFPEAKIVHLKRDAIATCWSNFKCLYINKSNGFSYNLKDLSSFFNLYKDLMDYWHKLYPNKIYDLCYEDLTINQEEETRKLLNYCDLNWDENCLNFHTSNRAVKTASSVQVRQKMYQGSSDAWKKYEAYLKVLVKDLKFY